MGDALVPPFSARIRGAVAPIDNDFPDSARIGLIHLLHELIARGYIRDWKTVTRELERITRLEPNTSAARDLLLTVPWENVFDFCERLYSHLAEEVANHDGFGNIEIVFTKSEIQKYIAVELQRLFLEENLAFEFFSGLVRRHGRRNTQDRIAAAELVLGNPRLSQALLHYSKALKFFRNPSQPDYENTVKEAVCAVEAAARVLFPDAGSTLGRIVSGITGNDEGRLPKSIADTFHGLYGFRNGGQGVGHGGATGGPATKGIAEYALAVAASQIVLLVEIGALSESDVPF